MPVTVDFSKIGIGDIGLRYRLYSQLRAMQINFVSDLKNLPPEMLEEHGAILLEAIERIKRDAQPRE